MTPRLTLGLAGLTTLVFTTAAIAQEKIKIAPAKTNVFEYSIQSKSEMSTQTVRKIDGEERAGRGGGGRPVKSTQTVVFQEGPAGTGWRAYQTAEASVIRTGRDGEAQANKIVGALHAQKVNIEKKAGKIVFTSLGEDGKALPRQVTTGIPVQFNIKGLLPKQPLEVEGKYEIKRGLANALRNLMHPVRAPRAARGQAGGRGQGGQGQGRGGQRGRQGRGRGGNTAWFAGPGMRILNSKKVEVSGVGQLVSVEEKDGHQLATISIKGEIKGTGTPAELGLTQNRRGGRRGGQGGGQGGGQRGGQGQGTAELSLKIDGTLVVDQTDSRLASLSIKGALVSKSDSTRTMNRNGEERKIETKQSTKGTFEVNVTCTDKGAPKAVAPATDGAIKK